MAAIKSIESTSSILFFFLYVRCLAVREAPAYYFVVVVVVVLLKFLLIGLTVKRAVLIFLFFSTSEHPENRVGRKEKIAEKKNGETNLCN